MIDVLNEALGLKIHESQDKTRILPRGGGGDDYHLPSRFFPCHPKTKKKVT